MSMFGYHADARSVTFEIQIADGLFNLYRKRLPRYLPSKRDKGVLLADRFTFTPSRVALMSTCVIAEK